VEGRDTIAVVVVDAQRDFLDRQLSPEIASWQKAFCVPGIERLLTIGRRNGWKIIHVGTQHHGLASLPAHHRRSGRPLYCKAGTTGCDFVVKPDQNELVLYKTWYSAFDADLEAHLRDVSTVLWAGVATDCCIQQSAFDAERRGMWSIIPFEAVSASSSDAFSVGLLGLQKSAASVIALASLESNDLPLDLASLATEQRLRQWYAEQESYLSELNEVTLPALISHLRLRNNFTSEL